jgi:hypothetical protein
MGRRTGRKKRRRKTNMTAKRRKKKKHLDKNSNLLFLVFCVYRAQGMNEVGGGGGVGREKKKKSF